MTMQPVREEYDMDLNTRVEDDDSDEIQFNSRRFDTFVRKSQSITSSPDKMEKGYRTHGSLSGPSKSTLNTF